MTTLCHSVRSWRSPSLLFQLSDVATRMLTTSPPLLSDRDSGSAPRLPTKITLFTPAIFRLHSSCGSDKAAGRAAPVLGRPGEPLRRSAIPSEAQKQRRQRDD